MSRRITAGIAGWLALAGAGPATAQDLSGVWRDADGRFMEVSQSGDEVSLRTEAGLLFTGTLRDGAIRLTYPMRTAGDVPFAMPVQVRRQLVGTDIRLEGTVGSDPDALTLDLLAETLQWNPQTFVITGRQPFRRSVTYRRSHVTIQLSVVGAPGPGPALATMVGRDDSVALRLYVPARWDGLPRTITVTVQGPSETRELRVPCLLCEGVIDNVSYEVRDAVRYDRLYDQVRLFGMPVHDGDILTVGYGGSTLRIRTWDHVGPEIRLMNADHEFNIRTDTTVRLAGDPFGGTVTGMFRASAVPRMMGDPARTAFIQGRLFSDADPQGLPVTLEESGVASDRYWSRQAFQLSAAGPSRGTTLRAGPGDRVYLTIGEGADDVAWVTGGGFGAYGVAKSPAWRVPISRAQYDAMRLLFPEMVTVTSLVSASHSSHCTDPGLCLAAQTEPAFERMLRNPAYLMPEEVIVSRWSAIRRAAAAEGVPPDLVAALLLQNMRSMNWNDIAGDGRDYLRTLTGKSVGISQTPYEIAQRVAARHGIVSLGIARGTVLSDDRTFALLFDADSSVGIAAAHLAYVADLGMRWARRNSAGAAPDFDLAAFGAAAGPVTPAQRTVAATLGHNVDQWSLTGAPPIVGVVPGTSPYQDAIVLALEDVRRNLRPGGALDPALAATPRVYIEAVDIGLVHQRVQPYQRGFRAGDVTANHFPRDRRRSPRIDPDAFYQRP